jgi:hypothetical protein
LSLAAPAMAASEFQMPVNKDFVDGEITWGSREFKGYQYKWKVIVAEGEIGICGAGYYPDPTAARATRKLMRQASITLNDRKIMTDMSYFTKVRRAKDLASATATCRSSGIRAPKGPFEVFLEWPQAWERF